MMQPEGQVETYLNGLVETGKITGIQYWVVDALTVRFSYVGGLRDIGANLPVTPDTTFMAASTTKVVTAAAILQLVQQGKIDLDKSLGVYYPCHPYGEQVTIRHLLNQSSGIPNPLPLRWLHSVAEHAAYDQAQEEAKLQAVMRKASRLRFAPGEKYAYSNISYWLLGQVIQEVSGQSYCDYLRAKVLAPLGIEQAELDCLIPDLTRHAAGYQRKYSLLGLFLYWMMDRRFLAGSEAGRFRLQPVYMDGAAYGGLNGTAHAFARFLQDQLRTEPVLLNAATCTLYFSPQKDRQGREMETTLGWHRGKVGSTVYYGKPGGGPGYHGNLRVYPPTGLATAWFTNETGVDANAINRFGDSLDRYFVI